MARKRARAASRSRSMRPAGFEGSSLREAMVWLVTAKVVAIVLVFDPYGLVAFDLPKSLVSRAFAWLLAGLLFIALLRYGTGIVPRTRLHVLVLAFALANVAATIVAENQYIALFGERGRYLGLTFIADMVLLYFAVAIAFRQMRDWLVLGAGVAVAAVLAIGYAAAQRLGLDPVRWSDSPEGRPFSTMGNPDMFGHFLGSAIGASLGVLAFLRGGGASRVVLVAAGVLLVALSATAAIVATRGTALGVAAALAVAPFLYLRVFGVTRRTLLRLAAVGVLTVIAGVVVLVATPLGSRVLATAQNVATRDRVLIYESAIRAFDDRPALGYGPNSFAVAYPRYRQEEAVRLMGVTDQSSAHSWVLDAAVGAGIVGLVALTALIGASFLSGWHALPKAPVVLGAALLALSAYWAHALVSVGAVGVDWIPWVGFGAVANLAGEHRETRARAVSKPVGVLAMGLAVLASASGWSAYRANTHAWEASVAWRAQQPERAIVAASAAVALDGGRADHWNWLGQARYLAGQWRDASAAFAEAASRSPHRAVYWSNLALGLAREAVDARRATAPDAIAAARRGTEIDPNNPAAHATLARVGTLLGEPNVALASALRAIALAPADPSHDRLAHDVALAMADPREARTGLETVLAIKDSAILRVALARLSLQLNDSASAKAHARRALELESGNIEAQAILRDAGG